MVYEICQDNGLFGPDSRNDEYYLPEIGRVEQISCLQLERPCMRYTTCKLAAGIEAAQPT